MRKVLPWMLIILIAIGPIFVALTEKTSAATSRIAVIKELTGTVKVKKSGGAKEFTVFAKMSLNEGDILAVDGNSSAILQFANGTEEDDKMTVGANSTLSFSKLSNKKGTTTKVSMFNGSAWVDVKSIENKEDEFSLETPTAIMGVRGTHLLVNVDPISGATHLTVAAGVVNVSTTDSANPDIRNVYPTENALITGDRNSHPELTIAPVDLERLMQLNDSSIVQAIIRAAADISEENKAKMDDYVNQAEFVRPSDESRYRNNVENLLGAIFAQALNSQLLTQERLTQILSEVRAQSGVVIDLSKKTIELSDVEKQRQNVQRSKEQEERKRALERKQLEDRERDRELSEKLSKESKLREEEKRKALLEKNKRATQKYESLLTEAEKKRFNEERSKHEIGLPTSSPASGGGGGIPPSSTASPTQSPTQSPTESPTQSPTESPTETTTQSPDPNATNALLSALTLQIEDEDEGWSDVDFDFESETKQYTIDIDRDSAMLKLKAIPMGTGASIESVKVDGESVMASNGEYSFLSSGYHTVSVNVLAPNGINSEVYALTIQRPLTMDGVLSWSSDQEVAWYKVTDDYFSGQTLTSLSEITFHFEFDSEVAYAEMRTPVGEPVRTDVNGNLRLTGLSQSSFVLLSLQLYNSFNQEVGYEKALWVMNGLSQPDFDVEEPFKLLMDVPSPYPIEYSETAEEDHYFAETDHHQDGALIRIPSPMDESLIVPFAVFDHQKDEFITSSLELPLQYGNNDFTVYVTDRTGFFFHTYELRIFRTPAPYPLTDWGLRTGTETESEYWNYVKGLYGKSRYYLQIPLAQETAEFRMSWDPEAPKAPLSYRLFDEDMDRIANGEGGAGSFIQSLSLEPGYNRYLLEIMDYENYPIKYELVIVRGEFPELTLGAFEIKQLLSENTSVAMNVYSTGPNSFNAVENVYGINNFSLRLLEHERSEVFLYASGYTSPDESGTYIFNNTPYGVKQFEILLRDITHQVHKAIYLDINFVQAPPPPP